MDGRQAIIEAREAFAGRKIVQADKDQPVHLLRFEKGTAGGKSTVFILAELEDGTIAAIETTLQIFVAASRAFEGFEDGEKMRSQGRG